MKNRLDVILVERGLFPSREKAKASIMAGIVYVDGQKVDKAGTSVDDQADIFIKENICPYVSRGGLKLEKALEEFQFHLDKTVCADIGASTGGFTDCMLQKGAEKVFAIDVGYGQLDWKLRNDNRVINMEKTNIRHLDLNTVDKDIDFISIDVSFISLKLVFPVASQMLGPDGSIVCLVKPQFEAGREQVGKKGIVRDRDVHKEVIVNVIEYGNNNGLHAHGLTFSPVTGAKGNIEYLLYLKKTPAEQEVDIDGVVYSSHEELEQ